jgi:hypothetical protein
VSDRPPPENAIVLGLDEKLSIRASEISEAAERQGVD